MLRKFVHAFLFASCVVPSDALVLPGDYPYAPAAGVDGSTAVGANDHRLVAWATEVVSLTFGSDVDAVFRDPAKSLGPAGGSSEEVLSLGRGGVIVLGFAGTIMNGEGDDFVVFENAFSDDFLELAWVEVSSDGEVFVRFPHYSATAGPVGAFGAVQPQQVHGFAGKYRQGFGTPFDLAELAEAHARVLAGDELFSEAYTAHLLETFPALDLGAVRYVRLVDVVGDGAAVSALPDPGGAGYPVYDPYPTVGSAGFDLDGVGVIHYQPEVVTYAEYVSALGIPEGAALDADGDGDPNGLEFLLGSGLLDPASRQHYSLDTVNGEVRLRILRDPRALGAVDILGIGLEGNWEVRAPELISERLVTVDERRLREEVYRLPTGSEQQLLRLRADLDLN